MCARVWLLQSQPRGPRGGGRQPPSLPVGSKVQTWPVGGFLDPGGIQGTKEVFYGEQQHTENVPQDGAYSCVPYSLCLPT